MNKSKSFLLILSVLTFSLLFTTCNFGGNLDTWRQKAADANIPVITIDTQPAKTTNVSAGSISGSLIVLASVTGNAKLGYQWYSNTSAVNTGGTSIKSATSANFPIPTELTTGMYYYFCEVSASSGAAPVRSNVAEVTVISGITINTQPVVMTNFNAGDINGNLSIFAIVKGGATLSYQWYENTTYNNFGGTLIHGATTQEFIIPTDLTQGIYYYFCEVKTADGTDSVRSGVATVNVSAPGIPIITISTQPIMIVSVNAGNISESLSVTASVSGGASISYQWYKNSINSITDGTKIAGETKESFAILTDLTAGNYYFFCEINATGGAVTVISNVARVEVIGPVIIINTQLPELKEFYVGEISGSLSISASATMGANINYQWYKNVESRNTGGIAITMGGNTDNYTIPATLAIGTYYYYCEVSAETAATVSSNVTKVKVNPKLIPDISNFIVNGNNKTYNGTKQGVIVNYNNIGIDEPAAGIITVYYSGTNGTTYEENTIAPVNAGTYDIKVETSGGTVYTALGKTLIGKLTISPAKITISEIEGVSVPIAGHIPVTSITANEQFSGTISWDPVVTGIFIPDTTYTASITLTATANYIFNGVVANFFSVYGAVTVNNSANSDMVNVIFPETGAIQYLITGGGGSFTATGGTITTATGDIQTVINAIRNDANTYSCGIQFADSGILDIGSASIIFNNTGGTWGEIFLLGSITSSNAISTEGSIIIADDISVKSCANIANTGGDEGRAIYNNSGTVIINGGTIEATTGVAIYHASNKKIIISGTETLITSANTSTNSGTIHNEGKMPELMINDGIVNNIALANGCAIYIRSGTIIVNGGLISATTGRTIDDYAGSSTITINGGRVEATTGSAICGRPIINGGVVSATSGYAIWTNLGTKVNSGMVKATTGNAIYHFGTGLTTISGTANVTSNGSDKATIELPLNSTRNDVLKIEGGIVNNTSTSVYGSYAIFNESCGTIRINGGKVESKGGSAIVNCSTSSGTGSIIISGTAEVTSSGKSGGTICFSAWSNLNSTSGGLRIEGGTVCNTSGGNAIENPNPGGSITVSGGTVSAITGFAILNNSNSEYYSGNITISGGLVMSKSGIAINNTSRGNITISGGIIEAATGPAIYNNSTYSYSELKISGGLVMSKSSFAINHVGLGTVTFNGNSTVFAYGNRISDVISPSIIPAGNALVVAWNATANNRTYSSGATSDLFKSPAGASVVWGKEGTTSGIRYANSDNLGFIEIEEVTVP